MNDPRAIDRHLAEFLHLFYAKFREKPTVKNMDLVKQAMLGYLETTHPIPLE